MSIAQIIAPVYAKAGIPEYWIVNLGDRLVEAYRLPSGDSTLPTYHESRHYRHGEQLEIDLDGTRITVPVQFLLPPN